MTNWNDERKKGDRGWIIDVIVFGLVVAFFILCVPGPLW